MTSEVDSRTGGARRRGGQPPFPVLAAAGSLTLTAALCGGLLALAAEGAPARVAVAVTTSALWAMALLALVPVVLMGPRGVMPAVIGCFLGMGLRLLGALGLSLVLLFKTNLPTGPVVRTLILIYLPLLFVEVAFVGRYLWQKDTLAGRCTESVA